MFQKGEQPSYCTNSKSRGAKGLTQDYQPAAMAGLLNHSPHTFSVANTILGMGKWETTRITHTKIQKIIYVVH